MLSMPNSVKTFYIASVKELLNSLSKKNGLFFLLHGNAPTHTKAIVTQFLAKKWFSTSLYFHIYKIKIF